MDHEQLMDEALALAPRGLGWVSPNPMVGTVVADGKRIIGRGWHQKYGEPHAEVLALREAGPAARGAALYCTLEPCNHTGQTPPCVNAIAAAGIRTVILGARDPNPIATGGEEALRAAGIEVVTGVREAECRRLNAPFFKKVRTGLPFVSLKWAMSADGKIAARSGDSKWISGEESRRFGHRLRAQHDAVLAGIGTVLADQPLFTCRTSVPDVENIRQPRRVILDSAARTPLDAPLWSAPGGGPVVIVCAAGVEPARQEALRQRGADVIELPATAGRVPLPAVLKALAERGVLSVLVEGGSRVLGSFIDERLADMAYIFIAPLLIGGADSPSAVAGRGAETISEALQLCDVETRAMGPDVLLAGRTGQWPWNK